MLGYLPEIFGEPWQPAVPPSSLANPLKVERGDEPVFYLDNCSMPLVDKVKSEVRFFLIY